MQESSHPELLEHTSVNQKSCRKAGELCTRWQGGDQDTAAIVEDKNETSRVKILLGFSLCFFSSFFLGLNFKFFPHCTHLFPCSSQSRFLLHSSRAEGELLQFHAADLLPCPEDSTCYWQLKTVSTSPLV